MDSFGNDDSYATLGLMKALLADLQVDDGDFSLEQLERELATLDDGTPPQFQQQHHQPLPTLDAASLVVSHQQQALPMMTMMRSMGMNQSSTMNQGVDAWSLSLQNFTAMSLQDDFLAADSARKKQQTLQPTTMMLSSSLEGAEEYDIGEKITLRAPPGLGDPTTSTSSTMMMMPPPGKLPFPRTPANSISILPEEGATIAAEVVTTSFLPPPAATATATAPSDGSTIPPPSSQHVPSQTVPVQPLTPGDVPVLPIVPPPQQQQGVVDPVVVPMMMTPMMMPPQGVPPPVVPTSTTELMGPPGPVLVLPPPPQRAGPAWQTPPVHHPIVIPPQPVRRVFCNPHPAAPPIPATALETNYMSARDVAYVIHSILKPVLAHGMSEDEYFIQYLRRLGGQANASMPEKPKDLDGEMLSRAVKSKEWSTEKGVLGHVAKTNVARPRALIATPTISTTEQQDSEQKQRATLWKARIYCDQGYQAYQAVVDIWSSAPPGSIPPQIQIHLVKLMKCMGITNVEKEYKVDRDSLALLIKLSKGRTLTARVLEQALLPPNAVQAVLPLLMDVLFGVVNKRSTEDNMEDFSTERLFRAITLVLRQLNTSSDTLLQCLDVVGKNGASSMGSTARLECVHALLQKGSIVLGQDPLEENRTAWGKAEGEFMNLIQTF